MRILVTGSSGFIGSHIASRLILDGHTILTYRRKELFPDCDTIVHCAAAAGPWHTLEDINNDNINLSQDLFSWASKRYIPIIFLSSINVYGDTLSAVVNEDSPLYPSDNYYAKSKLICENLLHLAEVSSVILRLPGVIGPNANLRNWLPSVARDILSNKPVRIHHAKHKFNNAVHVADLCDFISMLIRHDFDRETFVLGAGTCLTVEQVVFQLAICLSRGVTIETINDPSKPHFIIDCSRAINAGYYPLSLPQMIKRFADELLAARKQTHLDLGV